MFGLFKKKKTNDDDNFDFSLKMFVQNFDYVMQAIDPESTEEIKSRAINFYYERDPENAGFTASDFYLTAFTGAIFELTDNEVILARDSTRAFYLVKSFLYDHPEYKTPVTELLMNIWEEKLTSRGEMIIHLH